LSVAAVVFISPQSARRGVLLTRLRGRDAVTRLQKSQPFTASQPGWATFKKRMGSTPAFELRRGRDPAEAADALQGLLTGGALSER
jgi:hypothetical protein